MSLFLNSCFTSNFGERIESPREEVYEFSTDRRILHYNNNQGSATINIDDTDITSPRRRNISTNLLNQFMSQLGRQQDFKWSRLNESKKLTFWSKIARFFNLENVIIA